MLSTSSHRPTHGIEPMLCCIRALSVHARCETNRDAPRHRACCSDGLTNRRPCRRHTQLGATRHAIGCAEQRQLGNELGTMRHAMHKAVEWRLHITMFVCACTSVRMRAPCMRVHTHTCMRASAGVNASWKCPAALLCVHVYVQAHCQNRQLVTAPAAPRGQAKNALLRWPRPLLLPLSAFAAPPRPPASPCMHGDVWPMRPLAGTGLVVVGCDRRFA